MVRMKSLVAVAAALAAPLALAAEKPTSAKICLNCHQPEAGSLRGFFDTVAMKSKSIQIRFDDAVEVVRFDPAALEVQDGAKVEKAEFLRQVKKAHEIKIAFAEKDGVKVATRVVLKQPIAVPAESLMQTDELRKLVALGPEKGEYTLVDSRPAPRFQEGTIPTARNLPYPAFDKLTDRLPADKAKLLVFFCGGPTCSMSPKSAEKAKALGYTNVRVYREGMPAWSAVSFAVLSPQSLDEAWFKKEQPIVLLDARAAADAEQGFIAGAVSLPAGDPAAAVAALALPPADKKPPIVVYDAGAGDAARAAAEALVAKGFTSVKVLEGGFEAWQKAAFPVQQGKLGEKIAWAPKPKPGEIAWDEFQALAKKIPADTVVMDVRNADECKAGMIKGAKNVSADEIEKRAGDLPKDKRIVVHCSTGVRAEMVYNVLKDKGFTKIAFLNANVEIARNGKLKLSK